MPAYVVTWIHLVAAVTFIGGWLFFQLAVRPSLLEGKAKTPSKDALGPARNGLTV